MRAGKRRAIAAWAAACGLALTVQPLDGLRAAQAGTDALTGRVTSAEEGAMEGVLVSAQRAGSPITVTVVSDHDGRFRFPAAKLAAGRYSLRIRAVGYELDSPLSAEVAGETPTPIDLELRRTTDLAAQLTNAEWFISMPGSAEQKRPLIECMSCHTFERIARSHYDADGLAAVLKRMPQYANNTTDYKVQRRVAERKVGEETLHKLADYLATVNLSRGPWTYALKVLPRPTGRATRVIITEFDLPRRTIAPHDVRTDDQGFVWYSNFVENFLGRLDPRTGEHAEFAYPVVKPGFPTGALALEADQDGNLWLALMFQSGLMKFDAKTKTFRHFPIPAAMNNDTTQQSLLMPRHWNVDGKVWTNDVARQGILRLDVASGTYEFFDPFRLVPKVGNHSPYGMAADAENNLYFMDFGDENIGRIDAENGRSTIYPTPTAKSRPRRTMMDDRGRIWFAEFAANKVAMFDIAKERFQEWDVPTPHTYPYDVFLDRDGELWSGSMSSDRILRFDPESGRAVEYLLPRPTNIRRVFVDNSTTPVTFWAGSNHGASIIRLEPLD
jgi:streptogramin lyase